MNAIKAVKVENVNKGFIVISNHVSILETNIKKIERTGVVNLNASNLLFRVVRLDPRAIATEDFILFMISKMNFGVICVTP